MHIFLSNSHSISSFDLVFILIIKNLGSDTSCWFLRKVIIKSSMQISIVYVKRKHGENTNRFSIKHRMRYANIKINFAHIFNHGRILSIGFYPRCDYDGSFGISFFSYIVYEPRSSVAYLRDITNSSVGSLQTLYKIIILRLYQTYYFRILSEQKEREFGYQCLGQNRVNLNEFRDSSFQEK